MASELAIDSSDLDLVVIGLSFGGCRDFQISEMRLLKEQLEILKFIEEIKFIDSASIPIIKLSVDLQKVRNKLVK